IVERDEATCRQLFSRAKKHIQEHRPRFRPSPEAHNRMLASFMAACADGDLDALTRVLTEDVTLWSDGGGKASAATHPITGRDRVARFFLGLMRHWQEGMAVEVTEVNGRLGI